MRKKTQKNLLNSAFPLFYTYGSGSAFGIRIHITGLFIHPFISVWDWARYKIKFSILSYIFSLRPLDSGILYDIYPCFSPFKVFFFISRNTYYRRLMPVQIWSSGSDKPGTINLINPLFHSSSFQPYRCSAVFSDFYILQI